MQAMLTSGELEVFVNGRDQTIMFDFS